MLLQADSQETLDAMSTLPIFSLVFDKIKSSDTLVGLTCTPIAANNAVCNNMPLCCQDDSFVSVVSTFGFFLLTLYRVA
jgi:Fungal hydrophobin